jgi:hypothetical protein
MPLPDLYPYGWDYAWLAVDADGHVAVFTSAGQGPIPAAVLADRERADQAEDLVFDLPERGDYELLVSLPRPDDFIAFARRGLFAYDWWDVHRIKGHTFRYELLARPKVPVSVERMEGAVAALARRVRFEAVRFAESPSIAVSDHVECYPA